MELETKRLFLKTDCLIVNGEFTYPSEQSPIDILHPKSQNGERAGFALYLKSTGENVGHIDLKFTRKPYELSVGTLEEHRRQGYMNEALEKVISWLFENCDTKTITAYLGGITPAASRSILRRFGFVQENEGREDWWILNYSDWEKRSM